MGQPNLPSPLPLGDVPTISSAMDPISSRSTVPRRPLTAARVDAVLRRTKSFNGDDHHFTTIGSLPSGQGDDSMRGRPDSPVRANSRRRRSVASAPGGRRGSQLPRQGRTLSSGRQHPLGARDARGDTIPSRNISRASSQHRGISHQRSPSRGRNRRRSTPHPDPARSQQHRSLHRQRNSSERRECESNENIKELFKVSKATSNANTEGSRQSTEICSNTDNPGSSYVAKGTFLLHKTPERAGFHFPKATSQPEPSWRPGDGFSGDEAKPGFIFSLTGNRKRKRSRSLPGIGKLQVEAEIVEEQIQNGPSAIRPWTGHLMQRRVNPSSTGVKEIWPTIENFEDGSISKVRKRTETQSQKRARSTTTLTPTPDLMPKSVYQQVPLRNRGISDFENFGRPRHDLQCSPQRNAPQLLDWRYRPGDEGNNDDEGDENELYFEDDEVIPETDYSYETDCEYSDDQDEHTSSGSGSSRPRSTDNELSSSEDAGLYDSRGRILPGLAYQEYV
ncbi:hypothetical protein F5X99DRAFT_392676 [Biscogniauxia marginata]|nr:hypothetical protein F5X99DRAFT_392676 [Biscogniauxia marginata]